MTEKLVSKAKTEIKRKLNTMSGHRIFIENDTALDVEFECEEDVDGSHPCLTFKIKGIVGKLRGRKRRD